MKKLLFSLFCFPCILYAQDPSFSQFDLNMMNTNPAFSSYEGGVRILLHSRNQWNRLNENFNNSLLEISSRIDLNKHSRKLKSSWCFGLSYITEDLEAFPEIGNSIFLNKQELSLIPFTLELKITRNSYLTAAPLNISFKKYEVNWDALIFSDMIDDFGNYSTSNLNPNFFIHNDWIGDLSFGFIYTRHGKYSSTTTNRFNAGIAAHHILSPIESFSNNNVSDSKVPTKLTYHSEFYSAIPLQISTHPFIPYYRILMKHERYIKNSVNIMSKTEFGGTMFINNTPIEFGTLFRTNSVQENKIGNIQTWAPIIRYRISNRKHIYIISYSYDSNVSQNESSLQFVDTGTTHEVGFAIYLFSGKGRAKDCAAFKQMDKNPLYQDIMKNGLLSN